MNWSLVFIDDVLNLFTVINLKNPTAGEIQQYEDEVKDQYPNSFGIRLISDKKADKEALIAHLPKLEKYEELKYQQFLEV